jgi:hypothetical protein
MVIKQLNKINRCAVKYDSLTSNLLLKTTSVNRSFRRLSMSSLFSMISIISYGQTLKTFDGLFPNGKSQQGNATYKYYEDPETREYLKQGPFNYSFVGKGDYAGFNQTITGNYNKGLKDGTWTYKITMVDFNLGTYYHTGTITLISNYKNGLADGTWTEKYTDKAREKYIQYGQYYWGAYEPTQTFTTIMNFKAGIIAGNVDITDVNFRARGSYDDKGYTIGTWKIDLISKNQNLEITYKDNYMIDFTGRNAAGEILDGSTALYPKEAAEDFKRYSDVKAMTLEQREEAGFDLELYCGNKNVATKYINEYYENMMSNDWFLYEYTKGDLTYNSYNYSIPGGCNVVVQKVTFDKMNKSDHYEYIRAEEAYNAGRFIDAADQYFWFKENLKSAYITKKFRKSELIDLDRKILISLKKADSLSKIYIAESDFSKYKNVFSSRPLINPIDFTKLSLTEHERISNMNESESRKLKNGFSSFNYNTSKSLALTDFNLISELFNYDFGTDLNNIFTIIESQNEIYYRPFEEYVWEYLEKYYYFWKLETEKCFTQKYNSLEISTGKSNNGSSITFYSCNEDELKTVLLDRGKTYVDTLKTVLKLVQDFELKVNKIETLNIENSTKLLYVTYLPFLEAFKKIYSESSEIIEKLEILTTINSSLDKIIAHYSAEPKAIDKLLKKAVTKEEQAAILFQYTKK